MRVFSTYRAFINTESLPSLCASVGCLKDPAAGSVFCSTCQQKKSRGMRIDTPIRAPSVYAIRGGDFIKFGITWNQPSERLLELQTASPFRLELLGSIRCPPSWERFIHEALADYRTSGEWFHCNETTLMVANWLITNKQADLYAWLDSKLGSVQGLHH